ncbi:LysR family transcriptional regulator [Edaphobacter acidisoli]|uniref:LysR family transcriptional regulator n=1 Tax=Edaphobacter acidisoli TaxID=2040573 RepID=A0A916RWG7_9BACT|nr:LysR family transcriptional regulator [Edaphobacter acidisoli]GGA73472.1 LysR family transcriptional regulator [Edaphobacter acidisoli]
MHDNPAIHLSFRTQQFIFSAAQEGNFRRAARKLGVSPSLLTRSIDKLESDLGGRIFERSHSGLSVTDAGQVFLQETQLASNHITHAWDLARYRFQIATRPLRIGYSPYVHSRLIPVLEQLRSSDMETGVGRNPSKALLEAGSTLQLIDSVLRGKLDAAIGVYPIEDEDLWVKLISREPYCVCFSKNHRLAKQPSISIKDLDGEMVFCLPESSHPGLYARVTRYIESTGITPVLREVISFTHAMEIVSHNYGVALLPSSASRSSHMGVIFKPVTDKLLWIETALFARHDQRYGPLQEFLYNLSQQLLTQSLRL